MRRLTVLASAILVSSVSGAQDDAPDAGKKEKQPPPPPPKVELIDPGKDPKTTLRYKVLQGAKQQLVMTMKMDLSQATNGIRLPAQSLPGQKITADMTVTSVEKDKIAYDLIIRAVELVETEEVDPQVIGIMESMVEQLIGAKASTVITTRGIVEKTEWVDEGASSQALQQQLALSSTLQSTWNVLPEEPVGSGGKWKVTADIEANSIRMQQASTVELDSNTGGVRKLKVKIEQNAEPQDFRPPGAPPAAKARVKSMVGTGSGEILFDPTKLLPQKVTLETSTDMKLSTEFGGVSRDVSSQIKLRIGIEIKDLKE